MWWDVACLDLMLLVPFARPFVRALCARQCAREGRGDGAGMGLGSEGSSAPKHHGNTCKIPSSRLTKMNASCFSPGGRIAFTDDAKPHRQPPLAEALAKGRAPSISQKEPLQGFL